MRNGVELVIQHRDARGARRCHTYVGLSLSNPALIVIADAGTAASRADARRLWAALDQEIRGALGGHSTPAPCSGSIPVLGQCHARSDASCQKLLVIVGDALSPVGADTTALCNHWVHAGDAANILPFYPLTAKPRIATLLPVDARPANAQFWTHDPRESLAAILALSGITAEQARIFISYRQTDSASLAMQLFDALSHQNFDVFLDHFRIPPGVNFQARLTQELGDKSMMLLLESVNLPASPWVRYEIGVAKACGLGLLALLLPGGKPEPSLDAGYRQALGHGDFVGGAFAPNAELTDAALDRIVSGIKTRHDRALVARRRMLERSFRLALHRAKCRAVTRVGQGAFEVKSKSKTYLVWLTTRPPELTDFHRAHEAVASPAVGVIVGLSRLMEPARVVRTSWLAGLCSLTVSDEGQLLQVARQLASGAL